MTRLFLATLSFTVLSLPAAAQTQGEVLATYADIALAGYEDSLATARDLQAAIDAFLAAPSDATLALARAAWVTARMPYQQTEVFRFGNPIVDAWEGRVNAWPLDEGLIDYVDATYGGATDENALAAANIVASPMLMIVGREVDASQITPALIRDALNEAEGVETNVARGYHAIEFLLWGQDLNGTGPEAGARPYTDYVLGEDCSGGNCDRRADYLTAATALLVSDLEEIVGEWDTNGAARAAVLADPAAGIAAMLTGMGSLSYGELAGERMRLGLMLNDPEEEHDCFSDNTHASHYNDGLGMQNVYLGRYLRIDGTVVDGPSLASLVAAVDPALDAEMQAKLDTTMAALAAIVDAAEGGMAYDQMLAQDNVAGEALIMAGVDGLIDQTRTIERIVAALSLGGVALVGSDSLDNPGAVFE